MPLLSHVHETVLYASDLAAALKFYQDVLGLRQIGQMTGRGLVFRINPDSVLLIFDPAKTLVPSTVVPSHGATGPGHVGFAIPAGALEQWRAHLAAHNIPIEMDVPWPLGGRSLYVRDPAGNSVEFIDGRVWPD